jgi:hypothetical protein
MTEPKVDTDTGGASAPSEESGFGEGVDGLNPRPEPAASPTATTEPSSTSPTSEQGAGSTAPTDVVEGGGESSSVGAAGSVPPG